jgi:hypothetical protein
VPDLFDPQSLNRYSYVLNNPLKYVDPSGHILLESPEDPVTPSPEHPDNPAPIDPYPDPAVDHEADSVGEDLEENLRNTRGGHQEFPAEDYLKLDEVFNPFTDMSAETRQLFLEAGKILYEEEYGGVAKAVYNACLKDYCNNPLYKEPDPPFWRLPEEIRDPCSLFSSSQNSDLSTTVFLAQFEDMDPSNPWNREVNWVYALQNLYPKKLNKARIKYILIIIDQPNMYKYCQQTGCEPVLE